MKKQNHSVRNNKNIVLVGMPGSGKSTCGKLLAQKLGIEFTDTDEVLAVTLGKPLRDVVIQDGLDFFKAEQEEAVLKMNMENNVIATGGSVVLSDRAMRHLKQNSIIVYLRVGLELIKKRLGPDRRLARGRDHSLDRLFEERTPLYEKYADIIIECRDRSPGDIAGEIAGRMGSEPL